MSLVRSRRARGSTLREVTARGLLLDPDRFLDRAWLHEWIADAQDGRRDRLCGVEVEYVRAKRGRSLLLGVRLAWRTATLRRNTRAAIYLAAGGVAEATAKAGTLRLVEPAAGPTVLRLAAPDGLFLAFPNDRELRGLSAAADVRRAGNRLRAGRFPGLIEEGGRVRTRASRITPVRWKVGRRAVLRADLALRFADGRSEKRDLYLRVYPPRHLSRSLTSWRAAAALAPASGPPGVLGSDPERGLFAVEAIEGAPLEFPQGMLSSGPGEWGELARVLGSVHRPPGPAGQGLPMRRDTDELAAALRPLRDLAAWRPEVRERVTEAAAWLERAAAGLPAIDPVFVHGDLTPDQVVECDGRIVLLDWDEAAIADPHADCASFVVDACAGTRGTHPVERGEAFARAVLGRAWSEPRWRWHVAAAAGRRALAGLQKGRVDWGTTADVALDTIRGAFPIFLRRRKGRAPVPTVDPSRVLEDMLDPVRRPRLPGLDGRALSLAAVWPERGGFTARFEDPSHPGRPVVWLRGGATVEVWPFPRDPALPDLARLADSGAIPCGHRLGRRAALRTAAMPDRVLHLRPAGRVHGARDRLAMVHEHLRRSGLPAPSVLSCGPGISGFATEWVHGEVLNVASARPEAWRALGRMLARVHALAPPAGIPGRNHAAALEATARQVRLAARPGSAPGPWLTAALSRAAEGVADVPPAAREPRLVHGDLHPAQVVAGDPPVLLDWECAGAGEPEEDLANLFAHLHWSAGAAAAGIIAHLTGGYRAAGGGLDPARAIPYARLALLRILAIHSWRDRDRERVLAGAAAGSDWPGDQVPW